jgi:hypothetical protein
LHDGRIVCVEENMSALHAPTNMVASHDGLRTHIRMTVALDVQSAAARRPSILHKGPRRRFVCGKVPYRFFFVSPTALPLLGAVAVIGFQ